MADCRQWQYDWNIYNSPKALQFAAYNGMFHLNSISVEHITRSLCGIVLSLREDAPALNAVE